jgi:hypothetical protein
LPRSMSETGGKRKLPRTTTDSAGEVTKPVSPETEVHPAVSTERDVEASKGQSTTPSKAAKIVRQRSGRSWPPAYRRRGGGMAQQQLGALAGSTVTDAPVGAAESADGQTEA